MKGFSTLEKIYIMNLIVGRLNNQETLLFEKKIRDYTKKNTK